MMDREQPYYLGLDVGSLFVGLVLIDAEGVVVRREYLRHQGEPRRCLRGLVAGLPMTRVARATATGSGGRGVPGVGAYVDPIVAGLEGARRLVPDVRNIVAIGGGSFSLTCLDEAGHYRHSTMNSACASGTGAFLDQQALRLQIPPAELAERALEYDKSPPAVATRCAVFAKSDMIHLQQEGFSVNAIACGLCAGLGHSTVDGLLGSRKVYGKTALIGGVARNAIVAAAVRDKLGVEVVVPECPELVGAYGAALTALRQDDGAPPDLAALTRDDTGEASAVAAQQAAATTMRPPLELKLSVYPRFEWRDHWVTEDGTETAIVTPPDGSPVTLGIDIGSTSTKATILDTADRVIGWVYRKTAGNPIRAVQLTFKAFREMEKRGGFTLDIRGVGTTGSGRKMIAEVIGADLAVNEITAHARAAVCLDPGVDTILELGGQDAKFTQLENGMVYNSVMNYVCAAGTGSFIEEQALKLGIPLDEFAARALGQACPHTSDRCTVYMERDLDLLLARGWSKDQIAAAVLHSVCDNYLNKVVGGLHIGERVAFQGATARNKALVAAFEAALQKPIAVSPYCHLTGSLGMALLARERVTPERRSAAFRGLAFADAKVAVSQEPCDLCRNRCTLSIIRTGADVVAWGLKCGRDYGERRPRPRNVETFRFWRQRAQAWTAPAKHATPDAGVAPPRAARPRIGLPRSLGTYHQYPYWRAFFQALGVEGVELPPSDGETLRRGREVATAEICAPVLLGYGQARVLLEDPAVDYVFVPHLVRAAASPGFTDAHFCCYVQAHPSLLRAMEGLDTQRKLLSPVVQFHQPLPERAAALAAVLVRPLGVNRAAIASAIEAADAAQAACQETARRLGAEALAHIATQDLLGLVCLGRPYNTLDPALTLDLPRKIAELGCVVLYLDMLPFDLNDILPEQRNMYWHHGQRILAAAHYIARTPRLFAAYVTHFMCGPDSYVMTYFKEIMRRAGKPYVCLQFDGHGADAGYLTRVEAALESFRAWHQASREVSGSSSAPP